MAQIGTTVGLLLLLLFGAGGVGLLKCACSGRVTMAMEVDGNCCQSDRGCMTFSLLKVSDADMADESLLQDEVFFVLDSNALHCHIANMAPRICRAVGRVHDAVGWGAAPADRCRVMRV